MCAMGLVMVRDNATAVLCCLAQQAASLPSTLSMLAAARASARRCSLRPCPIRPQRPVRTPLLAVVWRIRIGAAPAPVGHGKLRRLTLPQHGHGLSRPCGGHLHPRWAEQLDSQDTVAISLSSRISTRNYQSPLHGPEQRQAVLQHTASRSPNST